MELGHLITQYRKEAGFTIDELAERSGVPKGTINKIISGTTKAPSLDTVRLLAHALGKRLADFDEETDSEPCLSASENSHIKKYRTLDGYGKNTVDGVLDSEYQRCIEQSKESQITTLPQYEMGAEEPVRIIWLPEPLQPAAAGYGQAADDETAEQVPVRYNEVTRKADYIMRVSGDSMEPKIHDGDRILLRAQPAVEEGEIGVFIRDSECVIKIYRGDYLESLNPKYGNLPFRGFSECKGLVLGVLRPEWIIKK